MTLAAQPITTDGDFLGDQLDTADFIRPGAVISFATMPAWRVGKVQPLAAGVAPPPLTDPALLLTAGYIHATPSPLDPTYVPAGQAMPGVCWLDQELAVYLNGDACVASGYSPFSVAGGVLEITADRTPPQVLPWLPAGFAQQFVSGAFCTYPHAQRYGYFEAKLRVPGPLGLNGIRDPRSAGLWPAFWMLPVSMAWPPEIDIMEIVGGLNMLNTTVHSPSYKAIMPNGSTLLSYPTAWPVDLSAGFHVFGCDWGPLKTRFYLDRKLIFALPTPSDCHEPFYLLVNLAVGGPTSWGGPPGAETVFPARLGVAGVNAWQRASYLAAT